MSKETRNYEEWDQGIEIDLKKVYFALKKGIKWVILTPIVFGLIAVIYVLFIAKPVYTSEAKILLVGSDSGESSLLGLARNFGFSLPSSIYQNEQYLTIETLPEILKSRSLTNSILFSEFTTKKFGEPEALFSIIFEPAKIAESDSSKLIAIGEDYIAKKVLEVKQVKNTSIFALLANSSEANLSAQIASRVIVELQKMQFDFSVSELGEQKEFVIGRLQEVQIELFKAEAQLKNFREGNLQISMSPALLLEQERLEREIDIQTALYISLKQQLEQIKINENKNISSIKIIDEPSIPTGYSSPKKKRIVFLLSILGIMVGGVISVLKYYKHINL